MRDLIFTVAAQTVTSLRWDLRSVCGLVSEQDLERETWLMSELTLYCTLGIFVVYASFLDVQLKNLCSKFPEIPLWALAVEEHICGQVAHVGTAESQNIYKSGTHVGTFLFSSSFFLLSSSYRCSVCVSVAGGRDKVRGEL